jgi:hypothetical protein
MSGFSFSIDLPVRSEWANVDLLRTSVQSCFTAIFGTQKGADIEGCASLAMVTGELLENAIKYGDWSASESSFRLKVWGEGKRAHIAVENPVRPEDRHAEEVLDILRWIRNFSSANEAYRARLLQIAADTTSRTPSKLGLVRIAYEGDCDLGAEVSNGVIRVTAERDFEDVE